MQIFLLLLLLLLMEGPAVARQKPAFGAIRRYHSTAAARGRCRPQQQYRTRSLPRFLMAAPVPRFRFPGASQYRVKHHLLPLRGEGAGTPLAAPRI